MLKVISCLIIATVLFAYSDSLEARFCPRCGQNHLPDEESTLEDDIKPSDNDSDDDAVDDEELLLSVNRERFQAPSVEIADACDKILDRLEERYGKPKTWSPFPIYFKRYTGNGIAGYTSYAGTVREVVVYEDLSTAVGGTLDHELTHAFFFYYLHSNFDLFLNEGLAQNSEYRRRESLRQTVYRRYQNGDFWPLSQLYGRNSYDNALRIYHEGFSVVDFLIGRGGSLWFSSFMEELVATNDIDSTLERFYGYHTLNELQNAWIDFIECGQDRSTVPAVI